MFGLRRSLALATLCCAAAFPLRAQRGPAPTGDRGAELVGSRASLPAVVSSISPRTSAPRTSRMCSLVPSVWGVSSARARARLGAELGEWPIEPPENNDPAERASVSDASLFAQYQLSLRVPFFLGRDAGRSKTRTKPPTPSARRVSDGGPAPAGSFACATGCEWSPAVTGAVVGSVTRAMC